MNLRGWNIQQLAKSAGLNPDSVYRHFAGKRPMRIEHLKAYMQAFNHTEQNTLYLRWIMDHGLEIALPGMFWVGDREANCIVISNQWLKFTGRSAEQELGHGWVESIHPRDREHAMRHIKRAHKTRNPFFVTLRLRRHDGVYVLINNQGQPYYTNGDYAGFVGCGVTLHA